VAKDLQLFLARFSIASVMALASMSAAFAQPMDAPWHMGMSPGGGDMHGHGLRHLGLTEAQQDQVFKIHHDQAPALRERMKAVRRAHEELQRSAASTPFDRDRARQLADSEAKAIADLAFMHVETMSRVRSILTPEQRARLDAGPDGGRGRERRAE
jgi:periplasmic protein CpxP/Spy